MDIWELLGIDETEDISQIKSAYAAKAKECHPEEHPEEYRMLQQAYKSAVQHAKEWHAKEWHAQTGREQGTGEDATHRMEQTVMPDLDYTKVDTVVREEVSDRFFREFRYIAQNPYLINHIACWRFFLNIPDYQPLLEEKEFPQKLADAVSRFAKWDRETILYFDKRLRCVKNRDSGQRSVFGRVRIRLLFDRLLLAGKNETMVEMKAVKIHGMMLEQVRNSGIWISDSPQNADAVERYLQFYFSYAAGHEAELEESRRKNRRFRTAVRAAETVGMLALLLAGTVLLSTDRTPSTDRTLSTDGVPDEKPVNAPYLPSDEELQRIEDMFEDTVERYQNWNEP